MIRPDSLIYLDCASGISGDMLLGALLDLGAPLEAIESAVQSLGLPQCRLVVSEVRRAGFRATKLDVQHPAEHVHRHLSDIERMIGDGNLTDSQKGLALRLFRRLGAAEALVHGVPLEKVHFHEVGAVDSIADIVGTAVAWDWLAPSRVVASPVPLGTGRIRIAHGDVALPAPATAELVRGLPIVESTVEAELTTPTGAVFLAELVDEFGPLPSMVIEQIGQGAGDRDFRSHPNILRVLRGRPSHRDGEDSAGEDVDRETICVLETEIDDQSPEQLGFVIDRLLGSGALDVYFTPVFMKKNRPGVLITVLTRPPTAAQIEQILFRETTTLGVRRQFTTRTVIRRDEVVVETAWGPVRGKRVAQGGDAARFAPEYDACREIAQRSGLPLQDIYEAAIVAFRLSSGGRS